MDKTVSIALCTYNGEKYLREQIDSILNQTYPIFEIVVQDDGSTDNTMVILNEYQKRFPNLFHIFIHEQEKRGNINHNFFSCGSKTHGEIIAFSDQDDIWRPDKIESLVNTINNNDVCFNLTYYTSSPIDFNGLPSIGTVPNFGLPRLLFMGGMIHGHAMIVKRTFFELVLQKLPDAFICSAPLYFDTILAGIALSTNSIVHINEYLTLHRVHGLSVTTGAKKKSFLERSAKNFLIQVFRPLLPSIHKTAKQKLEKRLKAFHEMFQYFPPTINTIQANGIIEAFFSKFKIISCSVQLVKCRDEIFYRKEPHSLVAIIRACFFQLTVLNYYC